MKYLMSLLCLLFLNTALCQSEDAFFLNLMKTEFEAFQKKDPAAWLKYIDSNAVFTGGDNTLKNREQIVEEIKNAPSVFLTATERYENIFTKIYRNTAVLSCLTTFTYKTHEGNFTEMKFKFTRVHIKEGKSWKLVYHSAIPVEI